VKAFDLVIRNELTAAQTQQVGNDYVKVIEQIGGELSSSVSAKVRTSAYASAQKIAESTADLLEKADVSVTKSVLAQLLASSRVLLTKTGNVDVHTQQLVNTLQRLTQKVVGRTANVAITPDVSSGKQHATIAIRDAQVAALLPKITEAVEETKRWEDQLRTNGVEQNIWSVAKIEAPMSQTVSIAEGKLPLSLLEKANVLGLERLEMDTPLGTWNFSPAFVTVENAMQMLHLKLEKVEKEDLVKIGLTETQRQKVKPDQTVYVLDVQVVDTNTKRTRDVSFKEGIELRIPYTLKNGEDANVLSVRQFQADGTTSKIVANYDAQQQEVVFIARTENPLVIASDAQTFTDVSASYWGKDVIAMMASKGIVQGRPDGTFQPDDKVTRAEFAKMIVLATGKQASVPTGSFTDISPTHWARPYIATGIQHGWFKGFPDGKFQPSAPITREQMAVILMNVLAQKSSASLATFSPFVDYAQIEPYAVDAFAGVLRMALFRGDDNGEIRPKGQATRAEAMTAIARLFAQYFPIRTAFIK
jgi:hypothetical protein